MSEWSLSVTCLSGKRGSETRFEIGLSERKMDLRVSRLLKTESLKV